MEQMLAQVWPLLWQAAPTFVLLILLHFYLKYMLFKPIQKAMDERKAATEGVREQSTQARLAAEKKAAEYEEALRQARTEVYKEQEQLRAELRKEQTDALASMRSQTEALLVDARKRIEAERATAQASLQSESDSIAESITAAALKGGLN
ncbi:MAG: ATP synthase F0 subunit B [Acidobacteriota bacterium]